ncbi:putative RNA polymerase ECF-subfamily sigma factor [Janibacter sp. HTCC2649]|uniref:sigma factor-like helix-turn-helix DNA-binding protein n=1 Tax=Janibacter sp. HTCC2649 TaxID=313589 RepID=UPI000066EADE|nr:sigma factor-like helix-turn-helix DNA-binding protein [Janibacter sp. HTCC2649]EAP99461.1 putative RNA polymerase ECF-subfamily sigma factor [Janibacter sp. HTCC2649]
MAPSRNEVDDDFAEFVRARQHQVLRAAHLLCGDPRVADDLTRDAFVVLATRWSKIRDDSPDTYVRSVLYRDAMRLRHTGAHDVPALDRLSQKQRAVTVLLHFEHRSEHEAAEILGISVGAVRSQAHAGDGLDGSLLDAAEPVAERDYVDAAQSGAQAKKLRRRRFGMATAAAVALVAAAIVIVPRGSTTGRVDPAPSPSIRPTSLAPTVDGEPNTFSLFSVTTQVGPDLSQVNALPKIDDLTRSQLALPEVLTFGTETVMPTLSEVGNNSAPVRAVLLRNTPDGMRPVLVRPTLSKPFMLVDTVTLFPNVDEGGNSSEPLEVTAIANDRRHVMFLQPGKVLVLDAFSGKVTTFAVDDPYLEAGGWTSDGQSVIASSGTRQWRITPATGAADRLGEVGANPGSHKVVVDDDGTMRVLEYDAGGNGSRTIGGPRVLSQVWGTTFTNAERRLATGGFLNRSAEVFANEVQPDKLFQGVFAVDRDGVTSARLLLAPGTEGVSLGCCEVLGWAYNDQVLIRWNGRDLLAWNVGTGAVTRVSTLPDSDEGSPMGKPGLTVALAP